MSEILPAGAEPWPTILSDQAGRIRQSVREMAGRSTAPGGRPLAFLLDRNQRIIALAGPHRRKMPTSRAGR